MFLTGGKLEENEGKIFFCLSKYVCMAYYNAYVTVTVVTVVKLYSTPLQN